ncbi:MAG: hypothetical protein ACXWQO_10345 [Bdellovibrionota bacterium]
MKKLYYLTLLLFSISLLALAGPPAKAVEEKATASTADLAALCFEKAFDAHMAGSCNRVEACAFAMAGKACAAPDPHTLATFCIQKCQRFYTTVTQECFDSCVSTSGFRPNPDSD